MYFFLSMPLRVRRLHDLGKPGWWAIWIHFCGWMGLAFISLSGEHKKNKYGPVCQRNKKFIDVILNR